MGRNVTKLKNFVKYSVSILDIMTRVKYHNMSAGIIVITNYVSIVAKTFYTDVNFFDTNIKGTDIGLWVDELEPVFGRLVR